MLRTTERGVIVIGVEGRAEARRLDGQMPRGQKAGRDVGTPGGAALRAFREQAGRAQLWVEAEADLGTGYLQRVESGRVTQPGRATIERILTALAARYGKRRELLGLFGYTIATPLPTDDEIAWAVDVSRRELHEVAFPAYVLDCATRLVAWNRFFPRLLGVGPEDRLVQQLVERPLLAAWFDPASPLAALVVEPDAFLPALIRALRYEMRQLEAEEWYDRLLADLLADLPRFREGWSQAEREAPLAGAARALVPVRLAVPGVGLLQFRLAAEHFTQDARFRTIYYFPADAITMRRCAAWASAR